MDFDEYRIRGKLLYLADCFFFVRIRTEKTQSTSLIVIRLIGLSYNLQLLSLSETDCT